MYIIGFFRSEAPLYETLFVCQHPSISSSSSSRRIFLLLSIYTGSRYSPVQDMDPDLYMDPDLDKDPGLLLLDGLFLI